MTYEEFLREIRIIDNSSALLNLSGKPNVTIAYSCMRHSAIYDFMVGNHLVTREDVIEFGCKKLYEACCKEFGWQNSRRPVINGL